MCLDGEKNDRVAFQARADYQNHAIGWLHRGYSSLGGGKVVRFPRIWMVYGECRLSQFERGWTKWLFRTAEELFASQLAQVIGYGGRQVGMDEVVADGIFARVVAGHRDLDRRPAGDFVGGHIPRSTGCLVTGPRMLFGTLLLQRFQEAIHDGVTDFTGLDVLVRAEAHEAGELGPEISAIEQIKQRLPFRQFLGAVREKLGRWACLAHRRPDQGLHVLNSLCGYRPLGSARVTRMQIPELLSQECRVSRDIREWKMEPLGGHVAGRHHVHPPLPGDIVAPGDLIAQPLQRRNVLIDKRVGHLASPLVSIILGQIRHSEERIDNLQNS